MILRPEAAWSNATAEPPTLRAAKLRSAIECTKRSQSVSFAAASSADAGNIFRVISKARLVAVICSMVLSATVGSASGATSAADAQGRVFDFGVRVSIVSFDTSGPGKFKSQQIYESETSPLLPGY